MLSAWYNFAAPADPGVNVDLPTREAYRRGRLASLAILVLFLVIFLFMASISITSNLNVPVFLASSVVLLVLGSMIVVLNRRGYLVAVAVLMIVTHDGGIITDLFFVRGGIGLVNLPLFDLLVASALIAVSLLRPSSVFIVAVVNCAIVVFVLVFAHHAHDLDQYIGMSGWAVVVVRPMLLQLVVAIVTFLWVDSAMKALKRADQAEAMAAMEHAIAEYERTQADQKRSLEQGIRYLVDVQRRVANGDLDARVPITDENVLWPVAISFNNLLTRFQHLQQNTDQLQQIQRAMPYIVNAIREAKRTRGSIKLPRTGTILDALIIEILS